MAKMNSAGVELHVRSIFLQGLLLMNDANRPKKFSKWDKLWRMWNEWLNDSKITATEACLSYALSFNEISKILVGVDSLQQLQEICSYTHKNTPKIPIEISENDTMLLNPSNWK
jgi:predicted aldo/keto reductase-like oxidoreductase